MKTLRRGLAAGLAFLLAAASFPGEAAAALARVPVMLAPNLGALPALAPAAALAPAGFSAAMAPLPVAPALTAPVSVAPPASAPAARPALAAGAPSASASAASERAPAEAQSASASARFDGTKAAPYSPAAGDLPQAGNPRQAAALKKSIGVGLTFAAVEFAGGLMTGTLALQADALHLGGDRLLDAAALAATRIAGRPPTARNTYGWLKAEAVISLIGALAIAATGAAMIPGVLAAFLHPAAVEGWRVLGFASLSVISNLTSAFLLHRQQGENLGMRGAYLHALIDASGTLGVMAAAAASLLWGFPYLMPAATAVLVAMVMGVAWEFGRPAWKILMDAAPAGVDVSKLAGGLRALPGVASVRDLHVRALNSTSAELVATLEAEPGADHAAILAAAKSFVSARYRIAHSTIQIEPAKPAP